MKNSRGVTLLEIIIVIAIIGVVMAAVSGFMGFGFKAQKLSTDEFKVQSSMRLLSQKINSSIRDSSATFVLYKKNSSKLSEGWNYIMVSDDNKSVIKYEWDIDSKTHKQSQITDEVEGMTFKLEYKKNEGSEKDKLLEYRIVGYIGDKERILESELEALNALQVIDRGNTTNPANTLAYRSDPRPGEIQESQAALAMVLDKSGSMDTTMKNGKTRMQNLRDEANRLINNLAESPNVYISLTPFDSTANGSKEMLPAQANETANSTLINQINSMNPNGGTNTGDGIRRGYYRIAEFNDVAEKRTTNFMIILVDGVTTFGSVHRASTSEFVTRDNNIEDREARYSSYYSDGRYYGNGGSLDTTYGTPYVNLIGDMVKTYSNKYGEGIKVYVIGFNDKDDLKSNLNNIATATGAIGPSESVKYYEAGDESALREIFDTIKKDIDDSLWHIGGPS